MSRARALWATGLAAGLSAGLFLAVAWHPPRPRLIWNASASTPLGLYRIEPVEHLRAGDLVAITPPPVLARYLARRHYLGRGIPLLKHVAAIKGARLCRKGSRVSVNGRQVAFARLHDSMGRPLPVWHGCRRLDGGEVFLLNPAPDSMDGRYFGAISSGGLIGRAIPLLTRDSPTMPLRWRGWAAPPLLPSARPPVASQATVPAPVPVRAKVPGQASGQTKKKG